VLLGDVVEEACNTQLGTLGISGASGSSDAEAPATGGTTQGNETDQQPAPSESGGSPLQRGLGTNGLETPDVEELLRGNGP
jgi:hypothetical protein